MLTIQVTPIIMLDGNAMEAIRFYEQALGAKVAFMQTFGDAPEDPTDPIPTEIKDRVSHCVLKVGEGELFVADNVPGTSPASGDLLQICITTAHVDISNELFHSLQEGGQVIMPLEPIYFSPAYGIVKDRFGITFQIFTQRQ